MKTTESFIRPSELSREVKRAFKKGVFVVKVQVAHSSGKRKRLLLTTWGSDKELVKALKC